jgi:ABC-2 type transport system ATP-binding protein
MESVELLCDQVAMINRSRKILDGTIREVKSSFRPELFQVALSGVQNEIPKEWEAKEVDGIFEFSLSLSGKTPNQLLTELMTYGQVLIFREQVPSMEEIFIHQVKSSAHE